MNDSQQRESRGRWGIGSSASKIAFLMLTVTACVGFMVGTLSSQDFMILCSAAYGFYFANKGDSSQTNLGK